MFLPVSLLQQFLGPRIAVGLALGIKAATWVAVPIPGAAHAAAVLKAAHREPQLPQTVQLIQASHPGADHDRVKVLDRPLSGGRRRLLNICHIVPPSLISSLTVIFHCLSQALMLPRATIGPLVCRVSPFRCFLSPRVGHNATQ